MKISRTVQVGGAAFVAGFVTALVAAMVVTKRKNSPRSAEDGISGELQDMLGI